AEARDLGKLESSGTRTLVDILFTSGGPRDQRDRVDQIMKANRERVEQIMLGPKDGQELRRYEAGLAARAALRGALTAKQLKDWDELSAPATRPAGAGAVAAASTRPAADMAAEFAAGYATRFDV